MLCRVCGNELINNSKFCSRCGTKIEAEGQVIFKIKRTKSFAGGLSTLVVIVDGHDTYKLSNGQETEVLLNVGEHNLEFSFVTKRKNVKVLIPEQNCIELAINKVTGDIEIVYLKGLTDKEEKTEGQPRDFSLKQTSETVTTTFKGLEGKFKKIVSDAQNEIQKAKENSETYKKVREFLNGCFYGVDEEKFSQLLELLVDNNSDETMRHYLISFFDGSDIMSEDNLPNLGVYNDILSPILSQLTSFDGFAQYWEQDKWVKEKNVKTLSADIYEAVANENFKRVQRMLNSEEKNVTNTLEYFDLDGFYNPATMLYVAMLKYTKARDIQKYIMDYDSNTIAIVRRREATKVLEDVKRMRQLDAGRVYHRISMKDDKNNIRYTMWRSKDVLCFVADDAPYISRREQLQEIRKNVYTEIKVADIIYFKQEGEYHRDTKISGGGTNVFLSQSTLVRGSYNDAIKSETVVTDTRYVKLSYKGGTMKFSFESLETFKQMIPEKEYDVVEAIKKNNIISGSVQPRIQDTSPSTDITSKFRQLDELLNMGYISKEEYEKKKQDILKEL